MRFNIHHRLRYHYTSPVFFEPMVVRLRPRSDFAHWLLAFDLTVEPAPAGQAEVLDAHGNVVTWVWFNERHEHLNLDARSSVDTQLTNPFDYLIVDPDALSLPMAYDASLTPVLEPYRQRTCNEPAVTAWARRLSDESGHDTQEFVTAAMQSVHETCAMSDRDTGEPLSPGETIRLRQGACRDLAVLLIELCRSQSLASRFVSGYHLEEQVEGRRQLHAWAEVYLPGAGWRGYDPSYGMVVADRHVAVAAGRLPPDAAPTRGGFRGTGAASQLDFHIELHAGRAGM